MVVGPAGQLAECRAQSVVQKHGVEALQRNRNALE